MPPSRARRADIPLLVEYFVDRYARKAGKSIRRVDKRTLQLLQSYPWPGNIRELQNVIERSIIVCETEIFTVDESWLSQRPFDMRSENKPFLSEKVAATKKQIIESSSSRRSLEAILVDVERPNLRVQSGPRDPQSGRGAGRSVKPSLGFPQSLFLA